MLKITKNQGSIQVTADKSGFYPFDGTITFPTNSLFTATSANTDMITFKSTSNGDVQFVGNYKDITISGRSYDTKQKFLTAFSNLANQGSVDAYTKAETDAKIDAKQGKLKAGNGITLTEDATDNTTVVKTAVSLTDNGNGAYQVGDSITIDSKSSIKIGKKWAQEIEDMTDRVTTIAIGYDARTNDTQGGGDIAIGDRAQSFSVGAIGSIAIGKDTMANAPTGHSSIVIGSGAKVTNNNADGIVIGSSAKVNDGSDSIVIGNNARSETSSDSVAIGHATFSKQSYGIAIGRGAGAEANDKVTNSDSIAIGHFARADGNASIALGYYSKGQKGGVAIGYQGKAKAEKGIAIGEWALASVENGVAIGELAQTAADTPLVIRAGNKTVDGRKLPITMIQGDANGKISIIKGDGSDERMVIQDEIAALKNAGGSGGTVDAYTKAETDNLLNAKQNTLTAGTGITIDENNVISSTGGSGGSVDAYTKAETDTKLDAKQDKLTAGSGITITKDETAGTSTIATAVSLTDNGNGAYQIGDSIKIGRDTVAIGKYAYSYGSHGVAIGPDAHASAEGAVAIGHYSVASNDNPLVIRAGYKIVGNSKKSLTVLQSDANGKISIIKGDDPDERIVISDEITALKAEITTLKAEIAALKGGTTGA